MSENIVIVTTRHPDAANEHDVFGSDDVTVIDIDLGSAFDASRIGPDDWDEVLEWAQSLYATADECGNTNAANYIKTVAEETLAQCLPPGHDGCAVAAYITGAEALDSEVFDAEEGRITPALIREEEQAEREYNENAGQGKRV